MRGGVVPSITVDLPKARTETGRPSVSVRRIPTHHDVLYGRGGDNGGNGGGDDGGVLMGGEGET